MIQPRYEFDDKFSGVADKIIQDLYVSLYTYIS